MTNPEECCPPRCGCDMPGPGKAPAADEKTSKKQLYIELLAIDLGTCQRCIPTGHHLKKAVEILKPVAEILGIELHYHESVVRTPVEAKRKALLTSPTIRINGRDMAPDFQETPCESCSTLTRNNTIVDCREWFYRGQAFPYAPLPMLVETIMGAMLKIDDLPPVAPEPITELPSNLQHYFDNKAGNQGCCG